MNIWLIMIVGGLLTFGLRFLFIFLLGKIHIPESVKRALRFVPLAVLSAIIMPELILPSRQIDVSFANHRLIAGSIAIAVAYYTKNMIITILIGMASLIVLDLLGIP
jgi:branched-subunit amino acid transport protein